MGNGMVERERRRLRNEREGKKRGRQRVASHPMFEILKNTDCRTDLIGGGGNTDICPGRQTTSRRHWVLPVRLVSLLVTDFTHSPIAIRPIISRNSICDHIDSRIGVCADIILREISPVTSFSCAASSPADYSRYFIPSAVLDHGVIT